MEGQKLVLSKGSSHYTRVQPTKHTQRNLLHIYDEDSEHQCSSLLTASGAVPPFPHWGLGKTSSPSHELPVGIRPSVVLTQAEKSASTDTNWLDGVDSSVDEIAPLTKHIAHKLSHFRQNFSVLDKIDPLKGINPHDGNPTPCSLNISKSSKVENKSADNDSNALCSMLRNTQTLIEHAFLRGSPDEGIASRLRAENRSASYELLLPTSCDGQQPVTHADPNLDLVASKTAEVNTSDSSLSIESVYICTHDKKGSVTEESRIGREMPQDFQLLHGARDVQPGTSTEFFSRAENAIKVLMREFEHTDGRGLHLENLVASCLCPAMNALGCIHNIKLLNHTREVMSLGSKAIIDITKEYVRSFLEPTIGKAVACAALLPLKPTELEYGSSSARLFPPRLQEPEQNATSRNLLALVDSVSCKERGQQPRTCLELKVCETKPSDTRIQRRQRHMASLSIARRRLLSHFRSCFFLRNGRTALVRVADRRKQKKLKRRDRSMWAADETNYAGRLRGCDMFKVGGAFEKQEPATASRSCTMARFTLPLLKHQELQHIDPEDVVAPSDIGLIEQLSFILEENLKLTSVLCHTAVLFKEEQLCRFHIEQLQTVEYSRLMRAQLRELHALQSKHLTSCKTVGWRALMEKTCDRGKEPRRVSEHDTVGEDLGQSHDIMARSVLLEESECRARNMALYPNKSRARKKHQLLFHLGLPGFVQQEDALQNRLSVRTREALVDLAYLQLQQREEIYIQEVLERAKLYELLAGWFYTRSSSIFLDNGGARKVLRHGRPPWKCFEGIGEQAKNPARKCEDIENEKNIAPEGRPHKMSCANNVDAGKVEFSERDQTADMGPYIKGDATTNKSESLIRGTSGMVLSLETTSRPCEKNANTCIEISSDSVEDLMNVSVIKPGSASVHSSCTGRRGCSTTSSHHPARDGAKAAALLHASCQAGEPFHLLCNLPPRSDTAKNCEHKRHLAREQGNEENALSNSDEDYWSTDAVCESSASSLEDRALWSDPKEEEVAAMGDRNALTPLGGVGVAISNRKEQLSNHTVTRQVGSLLLTEPFLHAFQHTKGVTTTPERTHKGAAALEEVQPTTSMLPPGVFVEVITETSLAGTPLRQRTSRCGRDPTPPFSFRDGSVSASRCLSDRYFSPTMSAIPVPHPCKVRSTKRYMEPTTSSIVRRRDSTPIRVPHCSTSRAAACSTFGANGVSCSKNRKQCYNTKIKEAEQESNSGGYPMASSTLITRLPMESGPGVWSQFSSTTQPRNPYGYGPQAQQALAASLALNTPPRCVLATTLPKPCKPRPPHRVDSWARETQTPPTEGSQTRTSEVATRAEEEEHEQKKGQGTCSFVLSDLTEGSIVYLPASMRRAFHVPQYMKMPHYPCGSSASHTRATTPPSVALSGRTASVVSYVDAMHELSVDAIQRRCAAIAAPESVVGRPIRNLPQPFRTQFDCTTLENCRGEGS